MVKEDKIKTIKVGFTLVVVLVRIDEKPSLV